jgi:polyphosphate kinase
MSRNLIRRVEVLFPVEDRRLIRLLRDKVLETYLTDNVKAREMQADGSYRRKTTGAVKNAMNSQEWLLKSHLLRPRRARSS